MGPFLVRKQMGAIDREWCQRYRLSVTARLFDPTARAASRCTPSTRRTAAADGVQRMCITDTDNVVPMSFYRAFYRVPWYG